MEARRERDQGLSGSLLSHGPLLAGRPGGVSLPGQPDHLGGHGHGGEVSRVPVPDRGSRVYRPFPAVPPRAQGCSEESPRSRADRGRPQVGRHRSDSAARRGPGSKQPVRAAVPGAGARVRIQDHAHRRSPGMDASVSPDPHEARRAVRGLHPNRTDGRVAVPVGGSRRNAPPGLVLAERLHLGLAQRRARGQRGEGEGKRPGRDHDQGPGPGSQPHLRPLGRGSDPPGPQAPGERAGVESNVFAHHGVRHSHAVLRGGAQDRTAGADRRGALRMALQRAPVPGVHGLHFSRRLRPPGCRELLRLGAGPRAHKDVSGGKDPRGVAHDAGGHGPQQQRERLRPDPGAKARVLPDRGAQRRPGPRGHAAPHC